VPDPCGFRRNGAAALLNRRRCPAAARRLTFPRRSAPEPSRDSQRLLTSVSMTLRAPACRPWNRPSQHSLARKSPDRHKCVRPCRWGRRMPCSSRRPASSRACSGTSHGTRASAAIRCSRRRTWPSISAAWLPALHPAHTCSARRSRALWHRRQRPSGSGSTSTDTSAPGSVSGARSRCSRPRRSTTGGTTRTAWTSRS
jgi:hypothetical protein